MCTGRGEAPFPVRPKPRRLQGAVAGAVCAVYLLIGCSSEPETTVDGARCYPDTDKSMDITKPTLFLKLSMSADDRVVPVVEVVLYNSASDQIDDMQIGAGPVFQGESNEKVIPLNT